MDATQTQVVIVEYFEKNLLDKFEGKIDIHRNFIAEKLLDSLAVLNLIVFLESQFGITVDDDMLFSDEFQMLSSLSHLVAQRISS